MKYNTEHYIFNCHANSYAEENITKIAQEQEKCYAEFLSFFKLKSNLKITYNLYDTPLECGRAYRKLHPEEYDIDEADEEINGFVSYPEKIYAVYNSKIRCTGYHEDVHLLAADVIGFPDSTFIREGLAMFFDKTWQGIDNQKWAKVVIDEKLIIDPASLIEEKCFNSYDCMSTYALAGAFTDFFIRTAGTEEYRLFYQNFSDTSQSTGAYQQCFSQFLTDLSNIKLTESEYSAIVAKLNI